MPVVKCKSRRDWARDDTNVLVKVAGLGEAPVAMGALKRLDLVVRPLVDCERAR